MTYVSAEELSRRAIDIDEQGPNGQHVIFWRIQERKYDEVEDYLNAGVDIDVRGFRDVTPVIWAAGTGNWEMVIFLEERGADLGLGSRDGMTVCSVQDGKPTRLDTENGRALEEVRRILRERGLCEGENVGS